MKDLRFSVFDNEFKKRRNNIIATEKKSICFLKDFSYKIKRPLSIKERNKIGILRFFVLFSKI